MRDLLTRVPCTQEFIRRRILVRSGATTGALKTLGWYLHIPSRARRPCRTINFCVRLSRAPLGWSEAMVTPGSLKCREQNKTNKNNGSAQFLQTKSKAADRAHMRTAQEGYTIVQYTHTKRTDSYTTTDNSVPSNLATAGTSTK